MTCPSWRLETCLLISAQSKAPYQPGDAEIPLLPELPGLGDHRPHRHPSRGYGMKTTPVRHFWVRYKLHGQRGPRLCLDFKGTGAIVTLSGRDSGTSSGRRKHEEPGRRGLRVRARPGPPHPAARRPGSARRWGEPAKSPGRGLPTQRP